MNPDETQFVARPAVARTKPGPSFFARMEKFNLVAQAATSSPPGLPSVNELERVIARLRMAHTIYLQNP